MSAFVVNHSHINAIVTFHVSRMGGSDPQAIAQMLLDENIKSVEARYGAGQAAEFGVDPVIRFKFHRKPLSPVQVIKLCQCLEYQSCEHEGWRAPRNPARELLETVVSSAIRMLPGYSEAAWELDEAA